MSEECAIFYHRPFVVSSQAPEQIIKRRSAAPERAEIPVTYATDVEQAGATLDYADMVALAAMFERWALTEDKLDPDRRTKLVQWSADYEAIAAHYGPDWKASDPSDGIMQFLARKERAAQRS